MYFVMAAQPYIDVSTGLDFGRIAEESCAVKDTPKGRADIFEHRAFQAASIIFKKDGQVSVISAVFFGATKEGPYFFARSIRHSDKEDYRQPENCAAGCNSWIAGGYHDIIDKTLTDQTFFTTHGLQKGVHQLLSDQINADKTNEIGFPLSVLELNGVKEHWIEIGACGLPLKK